MGLEVIIFIFFGVLLIALLISEIKAALGYTLEPFCPKCNKRLHEDELHDGECWLCHGIITEDNVYYKAVKIKHLKGGK